MNNGFTWRVAGSVVLYNSDLEVIDNIHTYLLQVEKLYVIDNSEVQNKVLVTQIKCISQVIYTWLEGNKGIATALNRAAQAAWCDGFDYLLMMDDDSQASSDLVSNMLNYIAQQSQSQKIGIAAAQSDPNLFGNDAKEVLFAITSGSLLNLTAYHECGPFLEELFIDAVDHEYCFRLIEAGYLIISLDYLHLNHKIGETKQIIIFNKILYKWASHNPVRNYYMLRNFLYVINKYKAILPIQTKLLLFYALSKVCILNALIDDKTLLRFRYIVKAVRDFRHNQLGKLS